MNLMCGSGRAVMETLEPRNLRSLLRQERQNRYSIVSQIFRLPTEQVWKVVPSNLAADKRSDEHTRWQLFIVAATATAFILDCKQANPARRLATLLDAVSVMKT